MSSRFSRSLLVGYFAIALFMTGDGFELTFLSVYLVDHGHSAVDASLAFTVYGLVAALAAWSSGVIAEMFGARRVMILAGVAWLVLQVVFLAVALPSGSMPLILAVYGVRAAAYPLFIYSFIVLIAQKVDRARLATAMGWYWAAYSFGIGVFGTLLPSWLIPSVGETATLWLALPWVAAGVALCVVSALMARHDSPAEETRPLTISSGSRWRELARGATILVENRQIAILAVVRVICNLSLFGFPVIMPLYLTTSQYDGVAVLSLSQWMQLWGLMFGITIITNVVWGRLGDRFGWMRQMRWYGCFGCAVATLGFFYLPQWTGGNMLAMSAAAALLAIGVSAFVPMGAAFPALAPEHTGAAISAQNLAAGVCTFIAPAIATVLLPVVGVGGICWTYACLYVIGAGLTLLVHPPQPGVTDRRVQRERSAAARVTVPAAQR
ncbi:MFS transporter [Microbacterium sp. 4NA327F11]|uniref:MFS transporter n=1 Tax=Microbacterium sp. 4NA327F11 TaxID=2502229 RepID=UPI00201650FD|nr:MFS transporter [Microbacterium sp. 4NA327F11]